MEAHDLVFRYQDRGEPVLRGCSLTVRSGDRLLLEGASGGGKSTLASLLVGLRVPQSGLLLLRGLDRQTLGDEGWRQRVVSAPQFHENHVLAETFAFNLLMGRRWPPHEEDMWKRRPSVANSALHRSLVRCLRECCKWWEKRAGSSRTENAAVFYIARALLQGAEVVIFDESFAALDPENVKAGARLRAAAGAHAAGGGASISYATMRRAPLRAAENSFRCARLQRGHSLPVVCSAFGNGIRSLWGSFRCRLELQPSQVHPRKVRS